MFKVMTSGLPACMQMLPVMHRIAGDTYVFQQDDAPCSRDSSAIAAGDTTIHLPRSVAS